MAEAAVTVWPLSLSQHDVWLDQRAWPGSAHLNIGGAAYLRGPLDLPRFERALQMLVQQHEALRLVPLPDGSQRLLPTWAARLEQVSVADAADPQAAMTAWWQAAMRQPFAWGEAPPWRAVLLRAHGQLHGLFIQFHHLVMDGWGTVMVIRHWSAIYNALQQAGHTGHTGAEGPEAGLPGYGDFVQESQAYRHSDAFARDAAFWRSQWPSLPPPLLERRYRGAGTASHLPLAHRASLVLERSHYQSLGQAVRAQGGSTFNVLLAAVALYLARTLRRSEVAIGMPTLNRAGRRYRQTPGMFVGVLPLRLGLDERMTVRELLETTAVAVRAALRHARYPLGELSRELGALRGGRDGVLDVLLSFEQQDYTVPFGDAHFDAVQQLFSGEARYPLGVTLCEFHQGQNPVLELEGSSECWTAPEVHALAARLWHMARQLGQRPDARLAEIDLLPPQEREQVLVQWQPAQTLPLAAVPGPAPTVWDAVAQQVHERPLAPALRWTGGQLTYGELGARCERLAADLCQLGVRRGQVVALALPRSADWVVAALAVMRTGAAWLPLDLDAPLGRLEQVLEASEAVAVLLGAAQHERLIPLLRDRGWLAVDTAACMPIPGTPGTSSEAWPGSGPGPNATDVAYVLFTSGSTGQPKGVVVEHGALALRLRWVARVWGIGPGDVAGQATQLTFDPALVEWLLPLTCGAAVALPPAGRLDPQDVARWALHAGVTFMAFVPSTLGPFATAWRRALAQRPAPEPAAGPLATPRLRVACCGGEVLSPALARQWMQATGAQLYNVYGPTEALIFATAHRCDLAEERASLPIGQPLDDTLAYVLDENLRPLPVGVVGDLYLGGAALARGYLNRPELTAQAFVDDPFRPGLRLYRTGDRACWDSDGTLHFSGRDDRQVKLRGYRIELAEVEAVALQTPGVTQAVAQRVWRGEVPQLYLWLAADPGDAACVGAGGLPPDEAARMARLARTVLRERLPDYMQPAGLTVLPWLPQTAHGKVDEAQLPPPHWPPQDVARPPRTPLEHELVDLWTEALGHPVGVDDHFFEQGGDSLAAMNLLSALELRWRRPLHLHHLLEHPTVAELARVLDGAETAHTGAHATLGAAGVALVLQGPSVTGGATGTATDSATGPGPHTVYLVASGQGDVLRFQLLARALGAPWAVVMLQPPQDGVARSLPELAECYADAMAQHGPPRVLLGFSIGGVTALETARALQRRGQPPLGVVLLDTIYPRRIVGGRVLWRWLKWGVQKLGLQDLSLNGRRLKALFEDPGLQMQVAALRRHRVQACEVPTLLLKTRGLRRWERLLFRPWQRVFEGQRWQEASIPGLHGTLFEARHLGPVAERLRQWIDALAPAGDRGES